MTGRIVTGTKTGQMGFVYFVRTADSAYVKIGFTSAISRRMAEMRAAFPGIQPVATIAGPDRLEGELHAQFSTHHETGDWYVYSDEIKDYIESYATPLKEWPPRPGTARKKRPSELATNPIHFERSLKARIGVAQAARELGISPQRVRTLIAHGWLKAVKINPRMWIINRKDLLAVSIRQTGPPRRSSNSGDESVGTL